jgi:uncharacterized UPF0160 family protein
MAETNNFQSTNNAEKIIVAHNGTFHADDVFAVATILLVLENGKDKALATIVRTRDLKIISRADFVVDVGGEYDQNKNRFDHHQIGGAGVRENKIPYASFGLVWEKYGEKLSGNMEVAKKIDQELVQPIDAIDNGVAIVKSIFENIYPYNFHDFIDSLNPSWKEKNINTNEKFIEAISYAKIVLTREIKKMNDKFEAGKIVLDMYQKTSDKRVVVFDEYIPANDFLNKFSEPLFVISPREDGTWTLCTIRDDKNFFVDRKSLPKSWSGKKDKEFEKITGVIDVVFCHIDRFIAVAKTKEAILKLAEIALKE